MRSAWLLVLVAACVAEDLPEPEETAVQSAVAAPRKIRIATYNIHSGIPVDPALKDPVTDDELPGYNKPYEYLATIASQIRTVNADVVLLQEVSNQMEATGCDDQPTRLIQLLGDIYPYRHYAPDFARTQYACWSFRSVTSGQMILSKVPLNDVRNTPLEPGSSPSGTMQAQSAKIWKDGVAFRIYNTHFALGDSQIVAGFQALRAVIDNTVGDAVVIAGGDFNWSIWGDPVTQSPMATRPLFHHGDDIDHLWSDWPVHDLEGTFAASSPWAASDHPMMWWDLSWGGDNWTTLGQKRASGFGMNSTPSSAYSGNIYARNDSIPARGRKAGITDPWVATPVLGIPFDADPGYRATAMPSDPYGCELVAWRDGTFKWAMEQAPACTLSQPITTPQVLQSAPALTSFPRYAFFLGQVWSWYDYFVFANLNSGGTIAWSHYEGISPQPSPAAFQAWNVHTDGAAKPYSSPAVIVPGYMPFIGACNQIFIRDTNDRLQTKSLCYTGRYQWSPWTYLDRPTGSVNLASSPAAAAGTGNTMHACVIGTDANVYCKSYWNNAWDADFRSCGAPPGGAVGEPVVALDASGDLTVYTRGRGNRLWSRRCNRP